MRLKLLFLLLALLPTGHLAAQSQARTFTYDAAGNRTAMSIPVSQAPKKDTNDTTREGSSPISMTMRPDGILEIQATTGAAATECSAEIYDTAGRHVVSLPQASMPVTTDVLSTLHRGVYLIDVTIRYQHYTHKITKD